MNLKERLILTANLVWLGTTAFTTVLLVVLPAYLLLAPFSRDLYYKLLRVYVGSLWFTTIGVSETLNGVKVRITGTLPPTDVPILIISNHKCNLDWVYLWSAALRVGRKQVGYFAAVVKAVLRHIPVFGWAFKLIGFLFLSRSFEVDEPRIVRWARAMARNRRQPIWLVLYPEGTRYTERGKQRTIEAAKKIGVEPPKGELLLPRTKGFCLLMKLLRTYFHSVVDMTIAYVGPDDKLLSWRDLGTNALFELLGGALPLKRVHIHFEVFPAASLPEGDDKLQSWCLGRWKEKERLLEQLQEKGTFPTEGGQVVVEARGPGLLPLDGLSPIDHWATPGPSASGQLLLAAGFAAVSLAYGWLLLTSSWVRWYTTAAVLGMTSVCYFDPPDW